jgi:hypothetical protein
MFGRMAVPLSSGKKEDILLDPVDRATSIPLLWTQELSTGSNRLGVSFYT